MPFIQLTGGAYQNRSLIAAAQRCLNLFPEVTPQPAGEPIRVTHYCCPGLTLQATAPVSAFDNGCRGLYTASTGNLYAVYDQTVFLFGSDGLWTKLGSFQPSDPSDATPRDNPVSMQDNGFVLLIVDGSVDGYFVDLTLIPSKQKLTRINRTVNTGWLGADTVSFQDTFFLMNQPGTTKWYISLSNITANNLSAAFSVFTAIISHPGSGYTAGDVLTLTGTGGAQITVNSVDKAGAVVGFGVTAGGALNTEILTALAVTGGTGTGAQFAVTYTTNTGGFDPLDFVGMEAQVTDCVAAVSAHRVVWVLGRTAYEIWTNSGGTGTSAGSFPFTIYPVGVANFGVAATYSIATIMNKIFWVSQDKFGHGLIMMGDALTAHRISTHAIEFEIAQYSTINDAIAYTYQQMGHVFYVVSFPSANGDRGATWVYDESTDEWHERCYIDSNGLEYKHLGIAAAGAYGQVYVGDWRNGSLYTFDLSNYTDNGSAIKRLRSFPHQIDLEANRRVMYHQLIAQMQVGAGGSVGGERQTLLDCEFDATDDTLLQNFHNINAFGADFVQINPTNAIIVNDAVIGQVPGDVLYQVAGTPTTPDYTVKYTVQPTQYTAVVSSGNIISIIGRGVSFQEVTASGLVTTYIGYTASIYSDGTQYYVSLRSGLGNPMWLPLGTISSGDWQIYLSMQSTAITVSVYRTEDGMWLNSAGAWVASKTTAISITDHSFTLPGTVLIGGNWGGTDARSGIDGVLAAAQAGALQVTTDAAVILQLIGLEVGGQIGTFTFAQTQSISLIGVETDSQLGAISISNNQGQPIVAGISGVEAAFAVGSPSVSIPISSSITLDGLATTLQVGGVTVTEANNVSVGISGVAAISAAGAFVVSTPQSISLIGVSITATPGTVGVNGQRNLALGLAGVASTTQVGIPIARGSINKTVTGVQTASGIGTVTTFTSVLKLISGVQTVAQAGALTIRLVQNVSVHLVGVAATFQTGAPGTALPSQAPSQAVAAGFSNLAFFDDFTTTTTVTLTNSTTARPQFKWFPASWGGNLTSPTNVNIHTTWHAGDANMVAQGVSTTSPTLVNASPNGGIVQLQGGASNATLITIDGWATTLPTQGTWTHGYFEAYIQYQPALLTAANSAKGWPAWWSWTVQNIQGLGFGGSTFSGPYTEIDFWEYATAGNNLQWGGGAFHGSMSGGPYSYTSPGVTVDNNWHTIGCRWTPTAVDFYYDNVHVGTSTTPSATLEAGAQFLMLGCGLVTTGAPVAMYVDWVKVWESPSQVPGVPLNFTAGTASTSTIPSTWNTPNTGGAIDAGGYKLQYRVHGTTPFTTATVPLISPGRGSITGLDNAVWTVTPGGQVAIGGTVDPITSGVLQLLMLLNGQIWQLNNAGNWYSKNSSTDTTWVGPVTTSPLQSPGNVLIGLVRNTVYDIQLLAFNSTGNGPATSILQVTTANISPVGVYQVVNGQIIDPNGNLFIARGMAVFDVQIGNITPARIKQLFPKTNSIRLSIEGNSGNGYQSAVASFASITSWVQAARTANLVVIMDDHEQSGGTPPYTGTMLNKDLAYAQQICQTFQNDTGVMLQSMNEPGTANGLSTYHQAFYNACRQTGARNIIFHDITRGDLPSPGDPYTDNFTPYQSMYNCGWDVHFYNWMTNGNTSLSFCQNYLNTNIATLKGMGNFASASGGTNNNVPAVWVGECGWLDYNGNYNVDANGGDGTNQVVQASLTTNTSNGGQSVGSNNWLLDGNDSMGWVAASDMLGNNYTVVSQHGTFWNSI